MMQVNLFADKKAVYIPCGLSAIDFGVTADLGQLVGEVVRVDIISLLEQTVEGLRPDLVLSMDRTDQDVLAAIGRIRAKGIRTAVWFVDQPYRIDWDLQVARCYDYIFTSEKSCVPLLREAGHRAFYLPLGASTSLFHPHPPDPAFQTDICFIGSASPKRLELIDLIAPYLAGKKLMISGWFWDRLKNYHLLERHIRKDKLAFPSWIGPEEASRWYSGAKICINLHRDPFESLNSRGVPALSPNPRTFEISACGPLQISDHREDMARMYVPGEEIEVFHTPHELVSKLEYYLTHEEERRQIAARGLAKTVSSHTYVHRLRRLLDTVFEIRPHGEGEFA